MNETETDHERHARLIAALFAALRDERGYDQPPPEQCPGQLTLDDIEP